MKAQKITIRTMRGSQEVPALCIGHIAVHRFVTTAGLDDRLHSVTHLPSGIKFGQLFETRKAAIAAAMDINGLRDDWATFDPRKARRDQKFLNALYAIYERHGGFCLPSAVTRPNRVAAGKAYATNNLNGYKEGAA